MASSAELLKVSLFTWATMYTGRRRDHELHDGKRCAREAKLLVRSVSTRDPELELVPPSTALFNANKRIESVRANIV
jgi:hypothetical protein